MLDAGDPSPSSRLGMTPIVGYTDLDGRVHVCVNAAAKEAKVNSGV